MLLAKAVSEGKRLEIIIYYWGLGFKHGRETEQNDTIIHAMREVVSEIEEACR